MIYFRVNVWSKSMLSITSSKKSCMIEVMFSIIEFISFLTQFTKGSNTNTDFHETWYVASRTPDHYSMVK